MRSVDSTLALWLRGFLMATVIGSLSLCPLNPAAYAAEADVVGILALALEEDVSKSLGISPQVREQLLDLVDHREMDALDIALRIRSLPAAEQAAQLAPYRAKSEQMGLLLLTAKQRKALLAISAKRAGLESLAKSGVAARLKLSAEQREDVKRLISERDAAMQNVDRKELKRLQKSYERQFRATLSDEQFTTWQQLTELGPSEEKEPGVGEENYTAANPGNEPIQGDGRLMFNFRYAPWRGVLDWFSTQADLSLVMDAPPQGTFNYTDAKEYTPAEAIDLLNSVLQTKGYTLLRRQRMLMLINLEDGIPPNLIDEVSVDELDTRGEYELVRCLFSLERTSPEVAEQEVAKLIGPQGEVIALQAARKLLVRETAGRLRTVRKVLDAMEGKEEEDLGKATLLSLRYLKAADVMVSLRQLMGLAEDQNSAPDGSLRIAIGPGRRQMMVTGRPHRVKELDAVVKLLDVPPGGVNGPLDVPQLEIYSVTDADPTSVLEVMQTLLAGLDDVRLASDPKTGNLVALARPAQHETISATLAQMQRDRRQIEVIRLNLIDPQLAMMSIEKLFGTAGGEEGADANAPRVDADLTTQSLLIRGSKSQVADIRDLLEKLGENGATDETSLVGGSGNLRMLPITGSTARRVLEQVGEIWPSVRKNRIRTVTPSSSIRAIQPGRRRVLPNKDKEESSNPAKDQPSAAELPRAADRPLNNMVAWSTDTAVAVADLVNKQDKSDAADPAMADIIVTPGQRGILIASDDLEALDEFEQLVRTLADRLFTGSQEVAIFYLKYVKAEVAGDLLKQFLGGGGGDSDGGGGGGSLLSSLAGAALGGDSGGGGLIGSLLGLGGGGGGGSIMSMGSSLTITADTRLNALLLQASPDDLDFAEQILEVIDASAGPEAVQTIPRPQIIPVLNADADEIAAMVRTVYATRLSGQSAQPRQPSPEDLIRAMSGQRNKRRSMKDSIQDQMSVSINVDPRQNTLIVVAPQSVFEEIRVLVTQLDVAIPGLRKTIRTVSISRSNPETIQRALAAILGDAVQTTGTSTGGSAKGTSSASGTGRQPGGPSPQQDAEQFRRRIEFLQALQKSSQKAAKGKGDDSGPKK